QRFDHTGETRWFLYQVVNDVKCVIQDIPYHEVYRKCCPCHCSFKFFKMIFNFFLISGDSNNWLTAKTVNFCMLSLSLLNKFIFELIDAGSLIGTCLGTSRSLSKIM